MKLTEYFTETSRCVARAEKIRSDAESLVKWAVLALDRGRKMFQDLDESGLPPDAQEQLDAFRKMLDEGPPDGSPLGGEAAEQKPEPQRRRERAPCPGCGRKIKVHKPDCAWIAAERKRINAESAAGSVQVDEEKVSLAGRVRATIEKDGPCAFSALCADLDVGGDALMVAIRVLSLSCWQRKGKPMIGTWDHLVAEATKLSIKTGDRIGETAAALSISTDTAVRIWKQILDNTPPGPLLTGEKAP